MRPLKAKCPGGVGSNCLPCKILDRRPLAVWHTLLQPRTLMCGKGVSNQSIRSGGVKAAFYSILLPQCFRRNLFKRIGLGMRWCIAWFGWRPGIRRRGRGWWWSRLYRLQRNVRGPMIGIVPGKTGGDADQMTFGECERLSVAVAKEGKQADGGCCEKQKGQDDEQQDARTQTSTEDLRHSAPSHPLARRRSSPKQYPMQLSCQGRACLIPAFAP